MGNLPIFSPVFVVESFMINHDFRGIFLAAGLPEDQIDEVLAYLQTFGGAAKITSLSDYITARSTCAVMDERLDEDDVHSSAAHYLIALLDRIADWEDRGA